jgi:hypothetical protein
MRRAIKGFGVSLVMSVGALAGLVQSLKVKFSQNCALIQSDMTII